MQLLKALAIYTMAMLSPPGGHIGPELVAAASAVAEDWKDDALANQHLPVDLDIAAATERQGRTGKLKALGILKKLVGALGAQEPTDGTIKLRGANTSAEDDAPHIAASTGDDEEEMRPIFKPSLSELSREEHEKRDAYSSKAAADALVMIRDDFDRKGLTGSHEEKLPSEAELKEITAGMYDSIKADNETNATAPSTADAMMFMADRLEGDSRTTAFQEASICYDMFVRVLHPPTFDTDDSRSGSEEEVSKLKPDYVPETPRNLTALDMTQDELERVAALCTQPEFTTRLEELNYVPDHFCPAFQLLLPIRVPILPVEIQSNLQYLCGYIADDLFITAGEPECYHRMEEIVIKNGIANGQETPFPAAASTPTFDEIFLEVCYSHRSIDNPDSQFCENSLASIHDISADFNATLTTNVEFISHFCDAIGLHLPHPNTTLALRYASPHVEHKPGGKHGKIRHVIADLFNYAGHYKHGFMDRNGQYIEHPSDFLLDPQVDELVQTTAEVNGNQKNTYCTGVAFSVGGGVSVEAGPMSVGGGVDWGFGVNNRERDMYEESWVWGICMNDDSINIADADQKAKSPAAKDAKKDNKSGGSVSAGIEATVGFWRSVGDIPGTSKTYELSFQYLIVSGSIAVVTITTAADGSSPGWDRHDSFGGLMFSIGLSTSSGKSIDFGTDFCYGAIIPGEQNVWSVQGKTSSCGKIKYSMDWQVVGGDSTTSGLTAYYYKSKDDWKNYRRTIIDTWCGHPHKNNWFWDNDFYGVGVQAYGNDGYNIGTLKVTQELSWANWIDVMVFDSKEKGQTWSASRDYSDNGVSWDQHEWNRDGETRRFDRSPSSSYPDWQYEGKWHSNVMIDTWVGAGSNRELTHNEIVFWENGHEIERLYGTQHMNHVSSGKIDVGGTGGFDNDKLLKEFKVGTTGGGFSHKNDIFVIDYARVEYWDRHGYRCSALNDVHYSSSNYKTFGGDNSVGWCLIWSSGGSCWDVHKNHCYQSTAGDYWYFDATTGNHGFYGSYRTNSGFCSNPGKGRFREVWPECSDDKEEYLKIASETIDYDQESGLIPRSEVVEAILNEVGQVYVDIYGDGKVHKILLSNIQLMHSYNDVNDPNFVLSFHISGAVLEQYPDFKFTIQCGNEDEESDCQVKGTPPEIPEESETVSPTSAPHLTKSCNAVAEDVPVECFGLEYSVALYAIASPHFSLVAAMTDEDNLDCPRIIAFNSLEGEKKRHFVDESLAEDLPHHKFGMAKLGEILNAEEQVEAIKESEFDVATNNCVTYAADIWRQLGFKETVPLAEFLIEHVVHDKETPTFLDTLRKLKSGNGRRALAALALGKDSLKGYFTDVVYSQLFIQDE